MANEQRRTGEGYYSKPRRRATKNIKMSPQKHPVLGTEIDMRRPRHRAKNQPVTEEIGTVEIKRQGRKKGFIYGVIGGRKIETVKLKDRKIPWMVLAVAAVCTVMIMVLLFDYVRINELTNRYSDAQDEIVGLISDKKTLTIALEQKNDLIDFSNRAKELGMVMSDKVERKYISVDTEDKIIVPETKKGGIKEFFESLGERIASLFRTVFSSDNAAEE